MNRLVCLPFPAKLLSFIVPSFSVISKHQQFNIEKKAAWKAKWSEKERKEWFYCRGCLPGCHGSYNWVLFLVFVLSCLSVLPGHTGKMWSQTPVCSLSPRPEWLSIRLKAEWVHIDSLVKTYSIVGEKWASCSASRSSSGIIFYVHFLGCLVE